MYQFYYPDGKLINESDQENKKKNLLNFIISAIIWRFLLLRRKRLNVF